jgi:hypothetical protein
MNKGEPFAVIREEETMPKTKNEVENIQIPENITQFKETF